MAGRGSHMIKPAWMTREGGPTPVVGVSAADKRERDASDSASSSGDDAHSRNGRDHKKPKKEKKEKKSKKDKKEKKDKRKKRTRDEGYSSEDSHYREKRSKSDAGYPRQTVRSKLNRKSLWDTRPSDLPEHLRPIEPRDAPRGRGGGGGGDMRDTRHARRIYVGGIGKATQAEMSDFFNMTISEALHLPRGSNENFVLSVFIHSVKNYAFVELKTVEMATACMDLDGLEFHGFPLRINRPNDYRPERVSSTGPPVKFDLSALKMLKNNHSGQGGGDRPKSVIDDGPNKLFVGGLLFRMTDDDIIKILEAFGKLKALRVIREADGSCRGYCFCEYEDPENTDRAIKELNNLNIGNRHLTVRRSNPEMMRGGSGAAQPAANITRQASLGSMPVVERAPTPVLALLDMVTKEELADEQQYVEIVEEIESEIKRLQGFKSMVVPRPGKGSDDPPGLGKVFIEFESAMQATVARFKTEGRTFSDRPIKCLYIELEKYQRKAF